MSAAATQHHQVGLLITLAEKKGYALSVSEAPERWHLIGKDLRRVTNPEGGTDLSVAEARLFLLARPDE